MSARLAVVRDSKPEKPHYHWPHKCQHHHLVRGSAEANVPGSHAKTTAPFSSIHLAMWGLVIGLAEVKQLDEVFATSGDGSPGNARTALPEQFRNKLEHLMANLIYPPKHPIMIPMGR